MADPAPGSREGILGVEAWSLCPYLLNLWTKPGQVPPRHFHFSPPSIQPSPDLLALLVAVKMPG